MISFAITQRINQGLQAQALGSQLISLINSAPLIDQSVTPHLPGPTQTDEGLLEQIEMFNKLNQERGGFAPPPNFKFSLPGFAAPPELDLKPEGFGQELEPQAGGILTSQAGEQPEENLLQSRIEERLRGFANRQGISLDEIKSGDREIIETSERRQLDFEGSQPDAETLKIIDHLNRFDGESMGSISTDTGLPLEKVRSITGKLERQGFIRGTVKKISFTGGRGRVQTQKKKFFTSVVDVPKGGEAQGSEIEAIGMSGEKRKFTPSGEKFKTTIITNTGNQKEVNVQPIEGKFNEVIIDGLVYHQDKNSDGDRIFVRSAPSASSDVRGRRKATTRFSTLIEAQPEGDVETIKKIEGIHKIRRSQETRGKWEIVRHGEVVDTAETKKQAENKVFKIASFALEEIKKGKSAGDIF